MVLHVKSTKIKCENRYIVSYFVVYKSLELSILLVIILRSIYFNGNILYHSQANYLSKELIAVFDF